MALFIIGMILSWTNKSPQVNKQIIQKLCVIKKKKTTYIYISHWKICLFLTKRSVDCYISFIYTFSRDVFSLANVAKNILALLISDLFLFLHIHHVMFFSSCFVNKLERTGSFIRRPCYRQFYFLLFFIHLVVDR